MDAENRFQKSEKESSNKQLESLMKTYKTELRSKDDEIEQRKKCIEDSRLNEPLETAPCESVKMATLQEEITQTKAKWIAAEAHNNLLLSTLTKLQAKFESVQEQLASEVKRKEELNIALNNSIERLSAKETELRSRDVEFTFLSNQLASASEKLLDSQSHKQESIEKSSSETLLLIASLEDKLNAARSEFSRLQVEFISFKDDKDKLEEKVRMQETELSNKASHLKLLAKLNFETSEVDSSIIFLLFF